MSTVKLEDPLQDERPTQQLATEEQREHAAEGSPTKKAKVETDVDDDEFDDPAFDWDAAAAELDGTPAPHAAPDVKLPSSGVDTSSLPVFEINRAPVLTLWAMHVALRQGLPRMSALTLGRAVTARYATAKGIAIGKKMQSQNQRHTASMQPSASARQRFIFLFQEQYLVEDTHAGPRAIIDGQPDAPSSGETYLRSSFGSFLSATEAGMKALANSVASPAELDRVAYSLYCEFRPNGHERIGWGEKTAFSVSQLYEIADRIVLGNAARR